MFFIQTLIVSAVKCFLESHFKKTFHDVLLLKETAAWNFLKIPPNLKGLGFCHL